MTERAYYCACTDRRNDINVESGVRQTSVLKRVLISPNVNFFLQRQTHRAMRRAAATAASLCLSFSPTLVPLILTSRMTKWQRVGRPGPAILPFPFRNYANCRLPLLSSAAYCGRKRFVIDYARRTFGVLDSRKRADWWRTHEKERHVRKRDRNAVNASRRNSERLKRDRENSQNT